MGGSKWTALPFHCTRGNFGSAYARNLCGLSVHAREWPKGKELQAESPIPYLSAVTQKIIVSSRPGSAGALDGVRLSRMSV